MILMIYNRGMCREALLPNLYNTDYSIVVSGKEYALSGDLTLRLEVSSVGWRLKKDEDYQMFEGGRELNAHFLKDGDIVTIRTRNGEKLRLIVADTAFSFLIMEKFDLSRMNRITIGKSKENMIRYDFRELISGFHAELVRQEDGWYITDKSSNGTFSGQGRIRGSKKLAFAEHLNIFGLHIVFLGNVMAVGAYYGSLDIHKGVFVTAKESVGTVFAPPAADRYFNRAPRVLPSLYTDEVEIDGPPARREVKERPWALVVGPSFTMAIPMVVACLAMVYIYSKNDTTTSSSFMYVSMITVVGSALFGAFWAIRNLRHSKKETAEEEENRFNAYSNYLIHVTESLEEKYRYNTEALRGLYPPAEVYTSYDRSTKQLWNRNQTHSDFLYHRLGVGDLPFQVTIKTPKEKFSATDDTLEQKPRMIREQFGQLHEVPVGISLMEKQLIGLVGGSDKSGAIALMHAIVAEIAGTHCYTDVKFVFLYDSMDGRADPEWECMRWFPHVWSEDRQMRYLAGDEVERRDVLFALSNVLRERVHEDESGVRAKKIIKPYYLVFVSDPSLLEGELMARYIYNPLPEYGMTTFLMTETVDRLPNACEEIVENDEGFTGCYSLRQGDMDRRTIKPDLVSPQALEKMGRALADIHVRETEVTSEIPQTLDFFSMYGVRRLEEFQVEERWRKNRTYNSMKALIGKKSGNADCYLDVHEKYHGPHGLLAGTTGSGKSETLQTYILSLALNFSPEDISFFIIDFKGGGMANLFSDLPHMAGQISNLSGNQVQRAMTSIKSENTRRQRIFTEYGVNNINLYTQLYKEKEATEAIPHLFIVIDEFAELKKEEPDFMRELISVAQVGRSLGVHLILATQKPSGTVDDNIRSNSRFRLCLRVQDKQDSTDMLHKPDAAYITQTGRGYLQVGSDEIYEMFQSGWSGAAYEEADDSADTAVMLLTRIGRESLVASRLRRMRREAREKESGASGGGRTKDITQLDAIVAYLREKARELGYDHARQLWMPVLKTEILLSELPAAEEKADPRAKWSLSATVGLYDDPQQQSQAALTVDFANNGNLIVCGSVVSGKSTFLQTMLYALLAKYTPDQLQCYILDYSSHLLAPFAKAPHSGGIVYGNQPDRLDKFMHFLTTVMDERRKLFVGGNYAQFVQANGQTLPAILIVIDNIAGLREESNMAYDDLLLRYVREGTGYGMYLAVSTSGYGIAELPGRIAENIKSVVSLEQSDKFKYLDVMRRTHISVLPEQGIKGRGLAEVNGRLLEFQTALSVAAEDDFARGRVLEKECAQMAADWEGALPVPIPEIPENPLLYDLEQREEYVKMAGSGDCLPFAYEMDTAAVFGVSLRNTYCYTIAGRSMTGKTNVLKLLLYGASRCEGQLVVIEPERMELQLAASECGASYLTDPASVYARLEKIKDLFIARNQKKRRFVERGLDEGQIYEEMRNDTPVFIFLSDLTAFFDLVYDAGSVDGMEWLPGVMENLIERGSLHRIYFFGCLRIEDMTKLRGYDAAVSFTDYKRGIYLGGNLAGQRLFDFQNVPYKDQSKSMKKGLGYAADDEDETIGHKIVIPFARRNPS